jgi:hypothetical protein
MASMAQADKVAVCESKFRIISIMLDVMYFGGFRAPAVSFAVLALIPVAPQNGHAFMPPCF